MAEKDAAPESSHNPAGKQVASSDTSKEHKILEKTSGDQTPDDDGGWGGWFSGVDCFEVGCIEAVKRLARTRTTTTYKDRNGSVATEELSAKADPSQAKSGSMTNLMLQSESAAGRKSLAKQRIMILLQIPPKRQTTPMS